MDLLSRIETLRNGMNMSKALDELCIQSLSIPWEWGTWTVDMLRDEWSKMSEADRDWHRDAYRPAFEAVRDIIIKGDE